MSNDRLKFSFMWQHQETGTWQDKRYTFGEVMNGKPYDDMSDNSLLKRYRHVATRQWTGLYDSEGVEIYEGDIVQPKYNDIRAVEAKMGERGAYNVGGFNLDNCRIIGNVFESPELVGKVWNRA